MGTNIVSENRDKERFRQQHADIARFTEQEGKPCSVAHLGPLQDETLYLKSRLLGAAVMMPDEEWPRRDGRCLTPVLNIRFEEVPYVPGELEGLAWATLYLDVDRIACFEELGNGNWEFRTYPELLGLFERECPEPAEKSKVWTPRDITWERRVDIVDITCQVPDHELFAPAWHQVRQEINPSLFAWLPKGAGRRNHQMTKLGGFPSSKQWNSGPSDPRNFVLQIFYDRDPGREPYDLCDCAVSYVGLVDGAWVLDTQSS